MIVGPFTDDEKFIQILNDNSELIHHVGVRTGEALNELYEQSQIVTYPTIDEA